MFRIFTRDAAPLGTATMRPIRLFCSSAKQAGQRGTVWYGDRRDRLVSGLGRRECRWVLSQFHDVLVLPPLRRKCTPASAEQSGSIKGCTTGRTEKTVLPDGLPSADDTFTFEQLADAVVNQCQASTPDFVPYLTSKVIPAVREKVVAPRRQHNTVPMNWNSNHSV